MKGTYKGDEGGAKYIGAQCDANKAKSGAQMYSTKV